MTSQPDYLTLGLQLAILVLQFYLNHRTGVSSPVRTEIPDQLTEGNGQAEEPKSTTR